MNTSNQKIIIIEKVAKIIPLVLAFLVPIFFLSLTTEFYSFTKFGLIIISTLLLVIVWGLKILLGDRIEFTKSKLDFPIFIFILVILLSTIFSLNKHISIFGTQGRWLGLFSGLIFLTYYYVSTPLLNDKRLIKNILLATIYSSTISTFVSILAYYKIYFGNSPFLTLQNFSLVGSTNTTILFASVSLILAISLISTCKSLLSKVALISSTIINFFFIALISSIIGWTVVIVGIILFLLSIKKQSFVENKIIYLANLVVLVSVALFVFLPLTRNMLVDVNFPRELTLPLRESWIIATSTVQEYPILATGPSTFSLNFTRYRPLSLNAQNVWNIRFSRPYNELLNVLSTSGIVGIVVLSFLAYKLLKFILQSQKSPDKSDLTTAVCVSLTALLTGFLFTSASISILFLTVSLVSVLVALQAIESGSKHSEVRSIGISSLSSLESAEQTGVVKKEHFRYIFSIPILALVIYTSYLSFKLYAGEFYMRKAILAASKNDGTNTYEYQRKAIEVNPKRDAYHTSYARTNLTLANTLASKEQLTENDKQTIQTLIAQAIRSSRISTEVLNPLNVINWETRAVIYKSIANIAQNANDWAIASYNTAIQLDPTNPRLRLDLGGIYYAQGDYLSAANQFRQATNLKQDYANAHYNFAQALLKLEDIQNGKRALEVTKLLLDKNSLDYELVEQQLTALDVATSEDKPTVEEITGIENATEEQEPLINEGENAQIDSENLDPNTLPQPEETIEQQEEE